VAAGVLALVTAAAISPAASADTAYTDPTGDTCKDYPGIAIFCGMDILTAADHVDGDGTVHLIVSHNGANCQGNGADFFTRPRYGIYDAGTTVPSEATIRYEIRAVVNDDYALTAPPAPNVPLASTTSTVSNVTTVDVSIPPGVAASIGDFTWLVGSNCIGERPHEAADIAPDTGLFSVAGSGGGGDTTPPTPPSSLTISARTATSLTLDWGAATDNVGVTRYRVYQGATLVAAITGRHFVRSGLACEHSYTFAVTARDAAGNESSKTKKTASTTSCTTGTAGNDILPGTPAADLMHGKAGNDAMHGQARGDRMYGDGGKDTVHGDGGKDKVFGGNGADKLYGGGGNDIVNGNDGASGDVIDGGSGSNDTCYYNAGDTTKNCETKIKK
jgi:Ca2+-binding RTX toxin-like protein